jgi:predicted permease
VAGWPFAGFERITHVIGLLLKLKLRLMFRALVRRGGMRTVLMFAFSALMLGPIWLGLSSAAYIGVVKHGPVAVALCFGLLHLAWLGTSLIFGSYAEGFDLRLLLRYPIQPRTAFWMNVIIAPVDLSALFLLPPLTALIVATVTQTGAGAGVLVALASLLLLLITGSAAQALIAVLGRYLRREWTRALIGLVIGGLFLVPAVLLRSGLLGQGRGGSVSDLTRNGLPAIADFFALFPMTAFPVRAGRAAFAHEFAMAALWLGLGVVFLVILVRLCARVALSEALNRHQGSVGKDSVGDVAASNTAEAAASRTDRSLEARLERILPVDLSFLVAHDLRTYMRTPQVLLGLLTALPVVLFLTRDQQPGGIDILPFMMAFTALITAMSLASNQFGLDQAGVRLLFLLPIRSRRLLVAKNIACATVSATSFVTCIVTSALLGRLTWIGAGSSVATWAAALPVVLAFGNRLSVRSPWRMTFRMGGAPPGAVASGFAQMAAMGAVAVLLAPGLFVLPMVYGHKLWVQLASLWITATIAALLWTAWTLLLPRAARALESHRESIIDRLAHASENG